MFLQGSILLSVAVCLVTCLPQPLGNCAKRPKVPGTPKLNVLPKVDAKIEDAKDGIIEKTGPKDLQGILGGNKLPTINVTDNLPLPKGDLGVIGDKPSLTNVGLPAVPAVSVQPAQLLDLNRRITRLEAVLKLEGRIQVVGEKIMATSGKEVDFETSISKCKSLGGHIATLMNKAENNAILSFVKIFNRYTYLGIREGSVPNTFHYLNGIPALYTYWRKNEPSGKGNESCVEIYTDGQWNDKACNQKRLTVCEF